jgi:hypothetical protein
MSNADFDRVVRGKDSRGTPYVNTAPAARRTPREQRWPRFSGQRIGLR